MLTRHKLGSRWLDSGGPIRPAIHLALGASPIVLVVVSFGCKQLQTGRFKCTVTIDCLACCCCCCYCCCCCLCFKSGLLSPTALVCSQAHGPACQGLANQSIATRSEWPDSLNWLARWDLATLRADLCAYCWPTACIHSPVQVRSGQFSRLALGRTRGLQFE